MTTQLCVHCSNPLPQGSQFCPQCGASRGGSRPDVPQGPEGLWEAILERLRTAAAPRYEVVRLLGYGGMAGVYLADEPRLGRQVAIKVMAPSLMVDPKQVERFKQEARSTARLSHPNIVTIHEIDAKEGLQFFVMSYVPGQTLREVLDQAEGPVPLALTVRWIRQIAGGLHHAHRLGIVHRDIKPGNVLLDSDGNALVTDFGIAKVSDEPGLTKTGMMVGTPTYMSPEQCLSEDVTGATDQYALGVLAYQMLTGQPPFSGATMAVLHAHVSRHPEPIQSLRPECPPWIAELVERMLAKDPAARWPSLADVLTAVEEQTMSSSSLPTMSAMGMDWGRPGDVAERGQGRGEGKVNPATGERTAPGTPSPATGERTASVATAGPSGATPPDTTAGITGPESQTTASTADAPRDGRPAKGALIAAGLTLLLLGGIMLWGPWRAGGDTATPPSPLTPAAPAVGAAPGDAPTAPSGAPTPEPIDAVADPPVAAGDPPALPGATAGAGAEAPPMPPASTAGTTAPPPTTAAPPTATPPPTPPPPAPGIVRIAGQLPPGANLEARGGNDTSIPLQSGQTQLPAGTWTLSFQAEGYQSDSREVRLEPGQELAWTPAIVAVAPPAADPPATAPPPPAFDAAAARTRIDAELGAFAIAFESREMARVLELFPSASSDWQNEWRTLIQDTRNIQQLSVRPQDIRHGSTTAERAETEFALTFGFIDFRNQRQSQTTRFLAALVPLDEGWRISELSTVR